MYDPVELVQADSIVGIARRDARTEHVLGGSVDPERPPVLVYHMTFP